MAGMQWLGSIPAEPTTMGYLADAMKGGMEAYGWGAGIKEKKETSEREEKRLGLAEKKLDIDLENIEYTKKRDTAKMIIDVTKMLDPSAAKEFVEDPMVKALFEDLEWPLPTELHLEEDFKKTAQEHVVRGEAMPGMTMDETKKASGILVPERKITGTDVKQYEKATPIPWWELAWPGAQTKAGKERLKFRERYKKQFGPGGMGGGLNDPLGARPR